MRHFAFEIDAMYQARTRSPRPDPAAEELAHWDDADNVFR